MQKKIQATITEKLGITCSIVLRRASWLPRAASDFKKPAGMTVVETGWNRLPCPLPVRKSGYGKKGELALLSKVSGQSVTLLHMNIRKAWGSIREGTADCTTQHWN